MKRNPFLKAESIVIRKVYGNVAVLQLAECQKTYDDQTGVITENVTMRDYECHISSPAEISLAVVDGKNYMRGDMKATVAYLDIIDIMNQAGRVMKSPEWGIKPEQDLLVFGGTTYRIIKLSPQKYYGGEPVNMKIQLRAV